MGLEEVEKTGNLKKQPPECDKGAQKIIKIPKKR